LKSAISLLLGLLAGDYERNSRGSPAARRWRLLAKPRQLARPGGVLTQALAALAAQT